MITNRISRIFISLIITVAVMALLVLLNNPESPDRILTMLGGSLPEGLIQGVTYFLFFFGILELLAVNNSITHEEDSFSAHLLPEQENWVLSSDDVNQLKLNMQHLEKSNKFLLTDLIKKACTKYRLSKSSAEVLGLVDSQVKLYSDDMESEQSFIRYISWAIPSVGFIGTVIGIAASLGYAHEANTPEGIAKVTGMLAVAFDTTLVSLVLSVFLMLGIHYVQKRQDSLFTKMNSYMIENLINRFYK